MKETTCHRSRLTIDDTLKKEIDIRKVCEEVDEEALEEDEGDDEADVEEGDEAEGLDDEDEDEDEDEEANDEDDDDEDDESDDGFHSDDEHGFAASDSEGEDSDYEWWKPGGSTAATSTEQIDRLSIMQKGDDKVVASSLNSMSSGQMSPHSARCPTYR